MNQTGPHAVEAACQPYDTCNVGVKGYLGTVCCQLQLLKLICPGLQGCPQPFSLICCTLSPQHACEQRKYAIDTRSTMLYCWCWSMLFPGLGMAAKLMQNSEMPSIMQKLAAEGCKTSHSSWWGNTHNAYTRQLC